MRKGASTGRAGMETMSLRASWRVCTWTVLSPTLTSTPFHQGMFSVGLSKLSPFHPEMGITGIWEVTSDLGQHTLHLSLDLVETGLGVTGLLLVHLVDAHDQLLDAQKLEQQSVLAGLALDDTLLVVALGDGSDEVTISRDHDDGNIGLRGTGDHVLDEILVARGINDGVVVLGGVELLGLARNGHTTLTLLLLGVHVEGEGERRLAEASGFLSQLLHLTLGDTTEIEDQTTSGGTLSGIDVTADGDRNVLLSLVLRHVVAGRTVCKDPM